MEKIGFQVDTAAATALFRRSKDTHFRRSKFTTPPRSDWESCELHMFIFKMICLPVNTILLNSERWQKVWTNLVHLSHVTAYSASYFQLQLIHIMASSHSGIIEIQYNDLNCFVLPAHKRRWGLDQQVM